MNNGDDIRKLLEEIATIQREHLAEYRRATQRAVDLQEQALAKQEQFGRLYRRVLAVAVVVVTGLIASLFLLGR